MKGASRASAIDLAGGLVGVEQGDVGAVDHDLAHVHVGQVQHAAEHAPVAALHQALLVVVLDGAADLGLGEGLVGGLVQVQAEQAEAPLYQALDGRDHRAEQGHNDARGAGEAPGHIVGASDGDGLGQHLGEDQHQEGDQARGDAPRPRRRGWRGPGTR